MTGYEPARDGVPDDVEIMDELDWFQLLKVWNKVGQQRFNEDDLMWWLDDFEGEDYSKNV